MLMEFNILLVLGGPKSCYRRPLLADSSGLRKRTVQRPKPSAGLRASEAAGR